MHYSKYIQKQIYYRKQIGNSGIIKLNFQHTNLNDKMRLGEIIKIISMIFTHIEPQDLVRFEINDLELSTSLLKTDKTHYSKALLEEIIELIRINEFIYYPKFAKRELVLEHVSHSIFV